MPSQTVAEAIRTIPHTDVRGSSAPSAPESHWREAVHAEDAADEFLADLDFKLRESGAANANHLPAIFREPASLSSAFNRMYRESEFAEALETMAKEVGETADAEIYTLRWNSFMGALIEKSFVVRAILEAADAKDNPIFDQAAATQIGRMENLMRWGRLTFQSQIEGELRESWPFRLVGFQFEQLNQPMNAVFYYRNLLKASKPEKIKMWREKAIADLARVTDPMIALRGIESFKGVDLNLDAPLQIDLPKEQIDFFFSHPDGEAIDLQEIQLNSRSFHQLWSVLTLIALEAGRNPEITSHLAVRYNPMIGSFLIKDTAPISEGALYPFGTEPPRSHIYSIVDRMGPGASLIMKQVPVGTFTLVDGRQVTRSSIGKIVIQLPDALAPERNMTFKDALSSKLELNRMPAANDTSSAAEMAGENSGATLMEDMFADIAAEVAAEAASTNAAASVQSAALLACVTPLAFKG